MTKIKFLKNQGYKWFEKNNNYFKGYFISNGTLYKGFDALNFLSKQKKINNIIELLKTISGSFAFSIKIGDSTLVAVDIARSIPIYYSKDFSIISDSSEDIRNNLKIKKENVNNDYLLELFIKQCVFDNNTVYDEIKTLSPGQYILINGDKKVEYYYRHYNNISKRTKDKVIKDFEKVIKITMDNLIKACNNRQIVLSLSGGYDSRFIACALKESGIENVVCYTYGKKDSFEVKESKKVAQSLNYKWINIEYTDEMIKSFIEEEDYFNFTLEHDYTIYVQNFIAVKELKRIKFCDDDAVFVTGLCADMPTGYYVKDTIDCNFSIDNLTDDIFKYYFQRRKLIPEKESFFKENIKKDIQHITKKIESKQQYIQIRDCLCTEYEHSRKFLNMNRIHEFFGHEWLLPCWDINFLNFWYSLEIKYRKNQNMYEYYLLNHLFNKYGVDDKKIVAVHSKSTLITNFKYIIGGLVTKILYPLGIPLKRKVDFNNFAPLEIEVYKRIKNKSIINYNRAALTQLLIIFVCEQRYGKNNVKILKKYFDK